MTYLRLCAAFFVVLASTVALSPLAKAQSTSSSSAYLYIQIQGPEGAVYGLSASSTGQLSPISGSPFKLAGKIIGSNKLQSLTMGQDFLHSYAVASDGAIGSPLSQFAFFGGQCTSGGSAVEDAEFDHSGKLIYVLLQNGSCAEIQSDDINLDGSFGPAGQLQLNSMGGDFVGLPSILGNETLAFSDISSGHYSSIYGFLRQLGGVLQTDGAQTLSFQGSANYNPARPDASPVGNYVVLQLYPGDTNPPQIGSFTTNSDGVLSSTNTPADMPTSSLENPYSTFSPFGDMFVLYADNGAGNPGNGIEVYRFNGAQPLTLYKKLLTGVPIDRVAWDNSRHLYAISDAENKLYVFTVTLSSITEDTEWSIGAPFSMVVASSVEPSGACPPPAINGINVCSPGNNATATSPVQINAAATVGNGVWRFELWADGTKIDTVRGSDLMDTPVSLTPGLHHLTFSARDTSGDQVSKAITVTTQ